MKTNMSALVANLRQTVDLLQSAASRAGTQSNAGAQSNEGPDSSTMVARPKQMRPESRPILRRAAADFERASNM
jgi:hypothetical protein